MAIRYNSGAAQEATGLKQMPIRARTHKTAAGGMSASLMVRVTRFRNIHHYSVNSLTGSCFSFEIGIQGPLYNGISDEVEQSFYSSPSASACRLCFLL